MFVWKISIYLYWNNVTAYAAQKYLPDKLTTDADHKVTQTIKHSTRRDMTSAKPAGR